MQTCRRARIAALVLCAGQGGAMAEDGTGARATAAICRSRNTPSARSVFGAGRSPGLRIERSARLPGLPDCGAWPVALGDLSGHGRGGGCAWGPVSPCRIPSSPVIDRHQRRATKGPAGPICQPRACPPMTQPDDRPPRTTSARHAAKMAKKKAARDRMMATKTGEKGLVIVHTGAGKGQVLQRLRHDHALHRASDALRGRAVHQGRLGHGRAAAADRRISPTCASSTRMGEGFTWETQDRARDIAAAAGGLGKGARS